MPTILVACASSIATSTIVATIVRDELEDRGYNVKTVQCAFNNLNSEVITVKPDLVLVTGKTTLADPSIPMLVATPILTGIGKEKLIEKIIEILYKAKEN